MLKTQLLVMKQNKPSLPEVVVTKNHLFDGAEEASVLLISSQAGSGKSTAVSEWVSHQSKHACWYTLDEWDNDIMQFFSYLISGIDVLHPRAEEALGPLLSAFSAIGYDTFLRAFIMHLHAIESPFIIVLDDYHHIKNNQIHKVLRTLLEHFPPKMQLVLISREDPPLPLAKLRVSKKLLEIKAQQLRFSSSEIRAYFQKLLSIGLDDDQVSKLMKHSEGWIAGIQMFALSINEEKHTSKYIDKKISNNTFIMEYLFEEVLDKQSEAVKSFLLKTSFLDFFSAELCDFMLEYEPGTSTEILSHLTRNNCFIISSEVSSRWFRYHPLFREMLKKRLLLQTKGELHHYHYLAGQWFNINGFTKEAIQQYILSKAYEAAAEVVELLWAEYDSQLRSATWLEMANKLPCEIVDKCPVILMGVGWALLDSGEIDNCQPWFERSMALYRGYHGVHGEHGEHGSELLNKDQVQFELLPITNAFAFAYINAAIGNTEGVFEQTGYALDHIPEIQRSNKMTIMILLGIAYWQKGDFREAERTLMSAFQNINKETHPILENSAWMLLGELYIQQGKFELSKSLFEKLINKTKKMKGIEILRPSLYLGLAKIAFLEKDNGGAYELLEKSRLCGESSSLVDWKYKYYLLLARVYGSEALFSLAQDCIIESRKVFIMNPIPEDVSIDDVEQEIYLLERIPWSLMESG